MLILVINFIPGNIMQIILGIPFVLFCPGYVFMIALFPRKTSIEGIYLLALSFGVSIAIIPLVTLVLNYTPWGIRTESIIYSLFAFLVIMSITAWFRSRRLPTTDQRDFSFTLGLPKSGQSIQNRWLSITLAIVVLFLLGTIGYVIAVPKTAEKYTEFYMLGINAQASDYPTNFSLQNGRVVSVKYGGDLSPGVVEQSGQLTLVIVNHEGQDAIYDIAMQIDGIQASIPFQGTTVNDIGPITLKPEEKWQQEIGIVPQHIGDNQKVKILLYKDGGTISYLELNLGVNVN
jgi:uncharacterized membrane protein